MAPKVEPKIAREIVLSQFEPHPLIALPGEVKEGAVATYKTNYVQVMEDIGSGKRDPLGTIKWLILNDLWFLAHFIMPLPEKVKQQMNHPFLVGYAREIQEGPDDMTLDLVARYHFKSTFITIGENLQDMLKNPDEAIAIFCYVRTRAKKFLQEIKQIMENDENQGCILLRACFPDVLWDNPVSQAPKWSEDDGLVLKRGIARRESTLEAWGLQEGMPTGGHYDKRVYDDIMTEDMADSPGEIEKAKVKFDSSQNLKTLGACRQRVVGTIYAYNDVLCYVRDKVLVKTDANGMPYKVPLYHLRFKPATADGTPNGIPVLMSQEEIDKIKGDKTFYPQQLLNPVPEGTQSLDERLVKIIEPELIPQNLYRFMIIDPAGDKEKQKHSHDDWAIMLFGLTLKSDDLGANSLYMLNAIIDRFSHAQAIEAIVRMYLNGGVVMKIGIEKVGLSTVELHVANALQKVGRTVSVDDGSIQILSPEKREKNYRIQQALDWPLKNGKLHISTTVPEKYRERILQEMRYFPRWARDDALDAWSYAYDVIKKLKIFLMNTPDQKAAEEADAKRNQDYDPMYNNSVT